MSAYVPGLRTKAAFGKAHRVVRAFAPVAKVGVSAAGRGNELHGGDVRQPVSRAPAGTMMTIGSSV